MSEMPQNNAAAPGAPSGVPERKRSPFTIIAIVLLALLVIGGGIAAAVLIMGQQQQLDHLTQMQENNTSSPAASESASPSPSASASPSATAAAAAVWNDVNGNWCMGTDCRAITGLAGSSGVNYVQDGVADANGCLVGFAGTSGEPQNAHVAYCPIGAAFPTMTNPSGDCHMTEDVTRERLYIYQDCSEPYYRG